MDTLLPITTVVRELQSAKQAPPKIVTVLGISTLLIPVFEKAYLPIDVMVVGRMMVRSLE